jgi:hypothetical protein
MATRSRQNPWISLGLSAALHAALLALSVRLTRPPAEPEPEPEDRPSAAERARQVDMVYLQPPPPPPRPPAPTPPPPRPTPPTPPPQPAPRPPERLVPPPAEKAQRTPEPDANAPPDAQRAEGEEPTKDDPAGSERTGSNDATPGSRVPADNSAATMESEARRIFGRPRLGTLPGVGPRASRPMEAYLPDHPEKCIPKEPVPRDSAAPVQYGIVVGRIYRQDNGRPLSGAHLQMLGTPYVTFTDDIGEYHFRFDMSMVDNCRTQYVRVTAPGYESRLLVLVVGPNVRSDDVILKRK